MKTLKTILAAAVILFAASCTKNSDITPLDSVDPTSPSDINVFSTKNYEPDDFCEFVGESFDDYLGMIGAEKLNIIPKYLISNIFDENAAAVDSVVAQELDCDIDEARDEWSVRVYNYTYKTISYTGEPITLSAALCVPVLNDEEKQHTLTAMSLCPPHMPYNKEFCPTANGTILMARTAFNHAVVVPDYQGRGVTSAGPYSSLHTHDHAVQAIHAAEAARTILRRDGFRFDDKYALYNVGVSEGGETSYEINKMIENDIAADRRDSLNLRLSFCANGIAQHSLYVTSQMSIYEYEDEESHKIEMDFYKDAFDCFTEAEKQGHSGEEFYSKDLLDSTNKIILDHPLIKVLQEGVSRNDITYNWNPKHRITIAASKDDNDVLYEEHALYMYNLLKNTPDGAPNTNVDLLSFDTPIFKKISDIVGPDMMMAHIGADICCFVHAIKYPDPGSEPIETHFFESSSTK